MISAQTIEAFWNAVEHARPFSVGLNCSLGPGFDVSVFGGAFREVERGDFLLIRMRGLPKSAVGDGV